MFVKAMRQTEQQGNQLASGGLQVIFQATALTYAMKSGPSVARLLNMPAITFMPKALGVL